MYMVSNNEIVVSLHGNYQLGFWIVMAPGKAYKLHVPSPGADLGGFLGFPKTPWRLDLLQKSTPALRQQI